MDFLKKAAEKLSENSNSNSNQNNNQQSTDNQQQQNTNNTTQQNTTVDGSASTTNNAPNTEQSSDYGDKGMSTILHVFTTSTSPLQYPEG